MSKPKSTIASLLARLFPSSSKSLSEKLSTAEFNAFAADASKLADAQLEATEADSTVADSIVADSTVAGADQIEAVVEMTATDYQARINVLEAKVTALETDKVAASGQIEALTNQLKAKAEYVDQLKASINPTAEEDASNATGADVLTDTDRQARASAAKRKELGV